MKIELTPGQRAARDEARAFVAAEITPHAGRWDREEAIPRELIGKLRERGWLGSLLDPAWGGGGREMISYGLLTEEIGRGCSSVRSLLTVHDMVAHAAQRFGTQEAKERFLPRMARGEVLGALDHRRPRGRRLDTERPEEVDHLRPDRRSLPGLRQGRRQAHRVSFGARDARAHRHPAPWHHGHPRLAARRAGDRRLPRAGEPPGR